MSQATPVSFTSIVTPEIRTAIEQRTQLQAWMKDAAEKETALRKKIVAHFFPKLKENTNTYAEPGLLVKVSQPVTRKLVEETFHGVMSQLDEDNRRLGTLISYVPKFSLEWYRAMPEDQRKIFDQTLEIKEDGMPSLEITFPEVKSGPVPVVEGDKPKRTRKPRTPKATA